MEDDAKKTQSDLKLHIEDSKNIELVTEDLKRKAKENAEKVSLSDATAATQAAAAHVANAEEAAQALHNDMAVKPLRTFQGDVADAIEKQKTSLIHIKMAEEERQRAEELEHPHVSGARYGLKAITLVISVILILVSGTIFAVTKYFAPKPAAPVIVYDTLIPYDSSEKVDVSRDARIDLVNAFSSLRGEQLASSSVKYLKFVAPTTVGDAAIPTSKLFSILATKAPPELVRAFSDTFMAGAYGAATPQPFLLLRVDSFDNAYSGMLAWEKTMMEDIGPLFTDENIAFASATLAPASTGASPDASSSTASAPAPSIFQDVVVNNRDTRAVRDDHGAVVLIYSFIDRNLLLVTTNEDAFKGMVDKLIASKLIR